jgi:arginine-tRNA-protein transferase
MANGVLHGQLVDAGPCPYLPDRRFQAFQMPTGEADYRILMDHRFRRSGPVLYRPLCEGCQACEPIRIPVADFRPRRDQRRTWNHNRDLLVTWEERGIDDERRDLYRRYQQAVHHETEPNDPSHLLLEDGGIPGGELHARDCDGDLLAVSVCDRVGDALSSVYCFYDPDERDRALGVFMALAEIVHARMTGLTWWYPGFYVAGCAKMAYKARYQPAERFTDAGWEPWTPEVPPG